MMRPILLKLSVALALTVAGYLYSHLRSKRVLPSLPPPPGGKVDGGPGLKEIRYSSTHEKEEGPRNAFKPGLVVFSSSSKISGGEENLLLPEFNDLVQKDFESTCISPTMAEVDAYAQKSKLVGDPLEQEVINLRSMVRVLGERERNLEIQLLEYYGLKEQELAVRELGNRLKINNMEAKFFTLKIESLQAENKRLEAQVSEHAKVIAELESARGKIKQLKRKIKTDGEQSRDQLSLLQQRVTALQEEESRVAKLDAEVLKKVQMLKSLEDELMELKNENSKLQCENSELATKLESTQILASSVFEDPEVTRMEEEIKHLQDSNSELEKEIERLQTDRCTDVEELVYLRWVNACLRYELRNYQPSPGKTAAKDLSKTLSPKSEEKAKQLILEYANSRAGENTYRLIDFDSECGSSSHASTLTEAGELDDFLCDNSTQNRSSSSSSSKSKLFSKLKRLVSRKEGHHHHQHQHQRNSVSSNRLSAVDGTDSSSVFSERRASISIISSRESTGNNPNDRVSSYENRKSKSKSFTNLRILDMGTKEKAGVSVGTVSSYSDIQSLRKLSSVGNTETTDGDGHDDLGSQRGYKEMILGEGGAMESVEDCRLNSSHDTPEKLELKKYAQALKSSRACLNVSKRPRSFAY
ncbi:protein CHUP1, chloroplastic-like [Aristolochia californica]|uniref:protein CHUP1, chloroplastic-like n=1 Tax=Aristolochia californica TaxID=171875 RepID=UPI0035D6476B